MIEHFLEPKSSGGRVKIELDLSNYATAKKVALGSLKFSVDKLDIAVKQSKIYGPNFSY